MNTSFDPKEMFSAMQSNLTYTKYKDLGEKENNKKFFAEVMEYLDDKRIPMKPESIVKHKSAIQKHISGGEELEVIHDVKSNFSGDATKEKRIQRFALIVILGLGIYLIFFNKD